MTDLNHMTTKELKNYLSENRNDDDKFSKEPERILYLAIPVDIYNTFFKLEFTKTSIIDYQIKLIVYDPAEEAIVQWLN